MKRVGHNPRPYRPNDPSRIVVLMSQRKQAR
jgi:hypothetical protein